MGGRGSGSGRSRAGGGGGRASVASSAEVRAEVNAIAMSYRTIDQASPKIQNVLDRAPVGTELVFDAYYSRAGMMQNAYTKKSSSEWEHTWRVSNGTTYWTVSQSSKVAASDIYNAITSQ